MNKIKLFSMILGLMAYSQLALAKGENYKAVEGTQTVNIKMVDVFPGTAMSVCSNPENSYSDQDNRFRQHYYITAYDKVKKERFDEGDGTGSDELKLRDYYKKHGVIHYICEVKFENPDLEADVESENSAFKYNYVYAPDDRFRVNVSVSPTGLRMVYEQEEKSILSRQQMRKRVAIVLGEAYSKFNQQQEQDSLRFSYYLLDDPRTSQRSLIYNYIPNRR